MASGSPDESWICGDFDGDYVGESSSTAPDSAAMVGNVRVYDLSFVRARVWNAKKAEGPPAALAQSARGTIRVPSLPRVLVSPGSPGGVLGAAGPALFEVGLEDVYIVDWSSEGGIERMSDEIGGGVRTLGRIRGRIYARVCAAQVSPLVPLVPLPRGPVAQPMPVGSPAPPSGCVGDARMTGCGCGGLLLFGALLGLLLLHLSSLLFLLFGVGIALLLVSFAVSRCGGRQGGNTGCGCLAFSLALLLAGFIISWLGLLFLVRHGCTAQSVLFPILLAIPLLLSPLCRRWWLTTLLALGWLLVAITWSVHDHRGCGDGSDGGRGGDGGASGLSPAGVLRSAIDSLRDRVQDRTAVDENAELVSRATVGSDDVQRVSVDDALRNPDAFFKNCKNSVYLSGDVLFGFDSATLSDSAKPHLRKLRDLIESRPGTRFVLEGHADSVGDPSYNVDLSARRARAVADWLTTEGQLTPDRIDTRGFGSTRPIITDPHLDELNRRVEVMLQCPDDQQGGSP